MSTSYYCKCGRIVRKATTADNTGNRQTEDCAGCPYLLPWGPMRYMEGKGLQMDVQGYACRMSKDIDYATRFSGSVTDKLTCYIVSLDFEFLERVSSWIAETYPNREIFGPFSKDTIRAVEYVSNGRYRMGISCTQNKAGMAAKAALLAQFFNPDGSRQDLDPEAEKQLILDRIAAGKAAAQEKETPCADSQPTTSPTPTAAPSSTPSPATEPIASTEEIVPGGQSKLYLNSLKSAAYRCSPEGALQFYLFSGRPKWLTSLHLVAQFDKNNPDKLPPAQWLDWWASVNLGWTEITQKEFEAMCKKENPTDVPTLAAAAITTAPAAAPAETSTTSESEADVSRCESSTSGSISAENSLGQSSPAETAPATQSPSGAAAACSAADGVNAAEAIVPANSELTTPAFDYTGMSARTVDTLHVAERMIREARWDYVINLAQAVSIAHEELCGGVVQNLDNSKHGNRGEDTFRTWCAYVGFSRATAYNLLQVNALMEGSTPEEQAALEQASPSLLYAAAKPSAPAELVQAVKAGDITTHKQYQDALARIKTLETQNQSLLHSYETEKGRAEVAKKEAALDRKEQESANAAAIRYKNEADRRAADQQRLEGRIKTLTEERDQARREKGELAADCNRLGRQAEKALSDKREAEQAAAVAEKQRDDAQQTAQDAQARIRELEARPVEVVGASPEDIAKWRAEGAAAAKKELQSELRQAQKEAAEQRRRAETAEEDSEQAAQEALDYAAQLGQARRALEQGEGVRMVRQAVDACEALLRPRLDTIGTLDQADCKAAMDLLKELRDKLTWATMNTAWPGDDWPDGYYEDDGADDLDEWEDEEA